ncbi:urease accessory protein UreF [Deinococcus sp.]|uniref:urease accessory protein UreF n=1 Tax=Deinococcus sp. TaxID=47478 RepID=UPI003C79E3BF
MSEDRSGLLEVGSRVAPLLRLLQLSDSALPAGAYAFSDGLETLTARGGVSSAGELQVFLRGQLHSGWGRADPPACALAWAGHDLTELDELLDLLKPVSGPQAASVRMGANLTRAARALWPQLLTGWSAHTPTARHHACVYGSLARALGVPRQAAVSAYVSSWLLGRAVSATRLMKLGGLEAQRAVTLLEDDAHACIGRALAATPDELGGFSPALDVAAAEQPGLPMRLFQS